jgi:hypothetical protein
MAFRHFKSLTKLQNTETSLDTVYLPTVLCSVTHVYSYDYSEPFFQIFLLLLNKETCPIMTVTNCP